MWIAKPLQSLSSWEREAWLSIQREQGTERPLSQTLVWGDAITALGAPAYLVFSPDERVGGLVHFTGLGFECINGPYLNWDDASNAARQFATFVMAITRLESSFDFIRIQPRWPSDLLEARLTSLPVPPKETLKASTLQIAVIQDEKKRWAALSPRIRRSIAVTRRAQAVVRSWEADSSRALEFAREMKEFGQKKGFYVPDAHWLQNLVRKDGDVQREVLRFQVTEARAQGSVTSILTCDDGKTAHYLFGFERRESGARSAVSTSAIAHFHVLGECAEKGIGIYDLNGFTDPSDSDHSYVGVSRFKAQFQGRVVDYASPLFWIEA
jgi:hypothetical protein